MHVPSYRQSIITDLMYQIIIYMEKSHEPYKVIASPFYIQLNQSHVAIHPDLAIIRHPERITTSQIDSLPLFIVAIAIDKAQYTDCAAKLRLYKELNIKEYWIIDRMNKTLHTYELINTGNWSNRRYKLPCKISTSVLPMLELCLDFG